jgi:eukaryotic-like serine/threonine-protein kinase
VSSSARRVRRGALLAPGYRVVERLRRGEVLDVFDVISEERHCRCVAKVLRPDRLEDRVARRRLLLEGRLLQRLTHLHLVRAYETLKDPQPAVILEALTGERLDDVIERRVRLSPREVTFLGLHLGAAVAYLHRHGILHLDLKPSNVVAEHGVAKLMDLSISRPPGRGRAGEGTPMYMAPEQARGGMLSAATDVWGLGMILYEAATGRVPFPDDRHEPFYPQLEIRAEPVTAHRRLPAELAAAIDQSLQPEPDSRPAVASLLRTFGGLAREPRGRAGRENR